MQLSDRLQRFLIGLLAVLLVAGTVLALRYVRGYRPLTGFNFIGASSDLPSDMALRFSNVRVVGRDKGKIAWTLSAGTVSADRMPGATSATFRSKLDFQHDITATLMDGGKPRGLFTAPQATYDSTSRILLAAGNIALHVFPVGATTRQRADDLTVEASTVIWNVGSHDITCPGPVHLTAPGGDVRGSDLAVNLQTRARSLHNVTATVAVDENDTTSGFPEALKGIAP